MTSSYRVPTRNRTLCRLLGREWSEFVCIVWRATVYPLVLVSPLIILGRIFGG
jgi:hypothetical protein